MRACFLGGIPDELVRHGSIRFGLFCSQPEIKRAEIPIGLLLADSVRVDAKDIALKERVQLNYSRYEL